MLKEVASKKDAEISSLQVFKEKYERGEVGAMAEKFKSRAAKPSARIIRASSDTSQKHRGVQSEVGTGSLEVICILLKVLK